MSSAKKKLAKLERRTGRFQSAPEPQRAQREKAAVRTVGVPKIFVPSPDSPAVHTLLAAVKGKTAVAVPVVPAAKATEGNCFRNVYEKIQTQCGRMQCGWAVWQHGNLFIEAEPHAIFDSGESWIDPTPNFFPDGSRCRLILFIPNDSTRDPQSTVIQDNIRIPLTNNPRLAEALKLAAERNALLNRVPREWVPEGLMYHYSPEQLAQQTQLEARIASLLSLANQ